MLSMFSLCKGKLASRIAWLHQHDKKKAGWLLMAAQEQAGVSYYVLFLANSVGNETVALEVLLKPITDRQVARLS